MLRKYVRTFLKQKQCGPHFNCIWLKKVVIDIKILVNKDTDRKQPKCINVSSKHTPNKRLITQVQDK